MTPNSAVDLDHHPSVLARPVTEVLAPWVWVVTLPFVVAAYVGDSVLTALLWGSVVAVCGAGFPMAVIVYGARRGAWHSHHVTNRDGRLVPLVTCITSVGVGIIVLIVGKAPGEMVALTLAMLASLVVCAVITLAARWKISMHAAVSAGAVAILVDTGGLWYSGLVPLIVLVCWSRVELHDHTKSQVIIGAVVGAATGGGLFWVLGFTLG